MVTTVVATGSEFGDISRRAMDSEGIGKVVIRIIEAQSQKAFLDQKLGEFTWPERYPSMEDPFVNLAAMVNWTNTGGGILDRFFDRRPALMGTGNLAQSISGTTAKGFLEVGSALPYAADHQFGLSSSQPVTEQAKTTIGRFIGMEKREGEWKKKKRLGPKQKENREKFFFKMAPLLGKTELTTQVNQRPFIGITPQNEQDIADSIEEFVAKGIG
ncbi:MAG: hypothetical protein DRQ55_17530 [Planctomycetota bacterium]|nr:MAG: hypothetical protein DRQ55_17530 [Planctomycetota bacterium]